MSETIYADLDEIVFEGRSKEYGAYEMRKKYNRFLERSALIAFILFIFLTGWPKI
jgi:protein TonB